MQIADTEYINCVPVRLKRQRFSYGSKCSNLLGIPAVAHDRLHVCR